MKRRTKKQLRIGESNPGLPGSHFVEKMRADNVSHYTNSDLSHCQIDPLLNLSVDELFSC